MYIHILTAIVLVNTMNKQVIAVKEYNMKTTKLYTTLVLIMTRCFNN